MSALANMLRDMFKATRFRQIQDAKQEGSKSQETGSSSVARSSTRIPLPKDHPARAQIEGRPPLPPDHPVYQAWARGELVNQGTSGRGSVASPVAASRRTSGRTRSRKTLGDLLCTIPLLPIMLPTAAFALAVAALPPIFLGVMSHRLWVALYNIYRVGGEFIAIVIAILIGPALILGFLISRVILRPIGRLRYGGFVVVLAFLVSGGLSLPGVIHFWWYGLPGFLQPLASGAEPFFWLASYTKIAFQAWPLGVFTMVTAALGWGLFLGVLD